MLRSILACALLCTAISAHGSVHVVDVGGQGDFLYLQDAINAAAEGDTLLVRPGGPGYTYRFVVDGKSLSIIADGTGTVACGDLLDDHTENVMSLTSINSLHNIVRNLGAGQVVVLRGLTLRGLEVKNVAGQVWLQSCAVSTIAPALRAESVARLVLQDSQISGPDAWIGFASGLGLVAGHGLVGINSGMAIEGCTLVGGDGRDFTTTMLGPADNTTACDAVRLTGGTLWLSRSTLTGGQGGNAGCSGPSCTDGANGGVGLWLQTGSPTVWSLGSQISGGPGGDAALGAPPGSSEPGLPGAPTVVQTGSIETLAGTPRILAVGSPVVEGESISLQFEGQPGELAFVLLSFEPGLLPLPARLGALQVAPPLSMFLVGPLPPSGTLSLNVPMVQIGAALETVQVFLQGLFCANGCVLGSAAALNLFDGQF